MYPGSAGASTMVSPGNQAEPVSTIHDGRIWSLQVVQQPIRARMCGFGDKVGFICTIHTYPFFIANDI